MNRTFYGAPITTGISIMTNNLEQTTNVIDFGDYVDIRASDMSNAQHYRTCLDAHMRKHVAMPALEYQKSLHALLAQSHTTDVGNALRMYARFGSDLRYVEKWGAWYVWNGKMWQRDERKNIVSLAQDMTGYILEEAKCIAVPKGLEDKITALVRDQDSLNGEQTALLGESQDSRRKMLAKKVTLTKWAKSSQSNRSLEAAIKQLQGIRGVTITPEELDVCDTLLNCDNGTLNLTTWEMQPHNRHDLITKSTGIAYDGNALCPEWHKFMEKVSSHDSDLVRFHRQLVGLGLTGERLDSILPINYGNGGNGKSVYIEMVKTVLGDYAMTANTELFVEKPSGGINNDVARLVGVRFLSASETREGAPLNEALVKQLTGGDKISARFLHAEFFDFIPKFTPMLLTNHLPTIKNNDSGIWRRIKLIPWLHDFAKDSDSKPFEEVLSMLRQESTGILAWAVEGLKDRRRNGLCVPGVVKGATDLYRSESDLVGQFLQETTVIETSATITKARMYELYTEEMKVTGHNALATNKLTIRLREKNIQEGKGAKGVRLWKGIREKTDVDRVEGEEKELVQAEKTDVDRVEGEEKELVQAEKTDVDRVEGEEKELVQARLPVQAPSRRCGLCESKGRAYSLTNYYYGRLNQLVCTTCYPDKFVFYGKDYLPTVTTTERKEGSHE